VKNLDDPSLALLESRLT